MKTSVFTHPELDVEIKLCVQRWFKQQCLNPYESNYLYYVPSTETKHGQLEIAETCPTGWVLGTNQRIMPNWTIEETARFVSSACRTLPLLPSK